ncbi:hypothetical protein TNCV_4524261, partial [Trichonephila clavipes]
FEPGNYRFKKQRLHQPCHAFLRSFLSLIGTQTVPGYLQFRFRSTSRSPYRFLSIVEGTLQGRPQKSNRLLAGGASQRHPQIPIFFRAFSLRFLSFSLLTLSRIIILLSSLVLLPPLSVSAPLISCPSAAPVGLNSLDLLSFCCPYRSQLNSSLAQWAPMSRCTLYVFRCAVVNESWVNESTMLMRLFLTPKTLFRNSSSAIREMSGMFPTFVVKG